MAALFSRRALLHGRIQEEARVLPPGFLQSVADVCESCRACINHCPASIISLQSGIPALDFSSSGCDFCGECQKNCPHSGVFFGADLSFPHVATVQPHCLALNDVDCQSCRDHCPTEAIKFRPRAGGPWHPAVVVDDCTGCGACIGHCPANAISASPRSGSDVRA